MSRRASPSNTSRPVTRGGLDGTLPAATADDFLFIPPATARSTRSHGSPRGGAGFIAPRPPTATVVGRGTSGLAERVDDGGAGVPAPPANAHRAWLSEKIASGKLQSPRAGGGGPALPPVGLTAVSRDERRRHVHETKTMEQQARSARVAAERSERDQARSARRYREHERLTQLHEAARKETLETRRRARESRKDAAAYTSAYVAEHREHEQQLRESARSLREQERAIAEQWAAAMRGEAAAARDASGTKAERRARIRLAEVEVQKARERMVDRCPPGSYERIRAEAARQAREEARDERDVWAAMRAQQREAERAAVVSLHDQIRQDHASPRSSRQLDRDSKRNVVSDVRAASATRAAMRGADRVEELTAARAAAQDAREKRQLTRPPDPRDTRLVAHITTVNEEVGEALRRENAAGQGLRRERLDAAMARKLRQRESVLAGTATIREARAEQLEANRQRKEDVMAEKDRHEQLRTTFEEQERERREALLTPHRRSPTGGSPRSA